MKEYKSIERKRYGQEDLEEAKGKDKEVVVDFKKEMENLTKSSGGMGKAASKVGYKHGMDAKAVLDMFKNYDPKLFDKWY